MDESSTVRADDLDPRAERSRAAALDAAIMLIIDEGCDAVTQHRVAERGEVSRATVYRHWPDREDLIRDALRRAASSVISERPRTPDVRADIEWTLKRLASQLADQGLGQLLATMIDRSERDPIIRETMTSLLRERVGPIEDLLRDAAAQGLLRADLEIAIGVAELIGPLIFRRLMANAPVTPAFTKRVVADFFSAYAPDGPRPTR
jgi:AcrR family transcriptional regulator